MDDAIVRASDAERTATADLLRRHHADGRLTTDELEERVERCYAARTRGELDVLTADLPGRRRRELQRRRADGGYRSPQPFPFLLPIGLVVVLAVVTHGHVLWLAWPLAFFLFVRFRRHPDRR